MRAWEIHPALVHFPISFLLAGVAADFYALLRRRTELGRAASELLFLGMMTGWVAAVAGVIAFFTAPHSGHAHEFMYYHSATAAVTMALFTWLAVLRRRAKGALLGRGARVLAVVSAVLLSASGYLGGYLVYHAGAGVGAARTVEESGHSHH
jgi:uncharacterized membrane protein